MRTVYTALRFHSSPVRSLPEATRLSNQRRDFVFAGVNIARRVWVAISHLGDGCAVGPIIPGRGTVLGRAITQCKPIQVSDVESDPESVLSG